MPKYSLTAKDLKSQQVKTIVDAKNKNAVLEKAFELDLEVIAIEEISSMAIKLKKVDKLNFIRLLAVTLSSSLPLLRGLNTIGQDASTSSSMSMLAEAIKADVERGLSLSEAMANQPAVFNQLEISLVHAGEASGRLALTMTQLYEYLNQNYRFLKKMRAALSYPLIVFGFSWLVVFIFLAFIVPRFKETYEGMPQASLPAMTEFLIGISDFFNAYQLELLLSVAVFLTAILYLVKLPSARFWLERWFIKLPLVGTLYHWSVLVRFLKTLGTLLQNQVSFISALDIATAATNSRWFEHQTADMLASVKEGSSLGSYFETKNLLPSLALQMVQMGEESGKLDQLLLSASDFYQQNIEFKSQTLEGIIQPIVIIFLGIFIAFLVLGLFLPLFDLPSALSAT